MLRINLKRNSADKGLRQSHNRNNANADGPFGRLLLGRLWHHGSELYRERADGECMVSNTALGAESLFGFRNTVKSSK